MEVVNIKKLKVRAFVKVNGEYRNWDDLSSEQKTEIGAALNEKALRAIGYVPTSEIKEEIKEETA